MKTRMRLLSLLGALCLVAAACGGDDADTEAAGSEDSSSEDSGSEDSGSEDADSEDSEDADSEDADSEDAGGSDADTGDVDCAAEDQLCVGLVTDVGKLDDKSFNQSAWEGVEGSGADLTKAIETQDSKDYATNIQTFIDEDFDVIVTVGFALGEATNVAATDNPEVLFIGVDQFQGETLPNVTGLIFNEDKAGFMAGALAGYMTETNTVAAVLGTDLVPPVVAFNEGFAAGVVYTNPDAKVISTYHPGGLDVAFVDPTWGADTARQAIDSGADVIFGAGGQTGNGALGEVAKEGGDAYCIGVDSDQWETVPEAHPCLITSAMKLITPGVQGLIGTAGDGSFEGGNFFGDVGLADYHDFDSVVPDEVKADMEEIVVGVVSGDIETGYSG